MTAPNSLLPRRIVQKTAAIALTTTWAPVVENVVNSGKAVNVKRMLVSNGAVGDAVVSVKLVRAGYGGNSEYPVVPSGGVKAGAGVSVLPDGWMITLEEGDSLMAKVVSGSSVAAICGYSVVE